MDYQTFLESKSQLGGEFGFEPTFMPGFLYPFQADLVRWSTLRGRSAIFADCGLGKTPMQLSWAQNVVEKTNGRILVLTPLAVSFQTEREAQKFGIEASVSRSGDLKSKIVITNYERLHYFRPDDFVGAICDESSILKNFDGVTKAAVTEFMRRLPYRLLCTATAAPNDYIELGTSSETLNELGYMEMLHRFFKSADGSYAQGGSNGAKRWSRNPFGGKFRFRGHAERDFWRWVCSWSRSIRKPSDMGYDDGPFKLPKLIIDQTIVRAKTRRDGYLIDLPAVGLAEQREERRRTLTERCEMAAEKINGGTDQAIAWCHLNPEGDLLEKIIPGAVQVAGKDPDDKKEELLRAFVDGEARVLVTKPTIAGFGLNFQNCSHQTFFPSHSFEQWYQAIRRSWRFGQKSDLKIDVIASEGEADVLKNLQRKQDAADRMFESLVKMMNDTLSIKSKPYGTVKEEVPSWL